MRRLVGTCILNLLCLGMMAQEQVTILDSVTIEGMPWTNYTTGLKVQPLAVESMHAFDQLNGLLQNQATLYLKTYGEGQLSTINIRGTSPSQNAIFWEGINVNITSLGLSDFSTTPIALSNGVAIQYGAASSLFGSDVIGGSVHLQQTVSEGAFVNLALSHGSFNRNAISITYNEGTGNWQHNTNVVHRWASNDFTYNNPAKRGNPEEVMDHADFIQSGISHVCNVRISPSSRISAHFWYQKMDRNIQPTLTGSARDDQVDETSRMLLQYHLEKPKHTGNLKAARLSDKIDFNGSISLMPRYYFSYEHEFFHVENLSAKIGANWQHLKADIEDYGGKISENRNDIFLLLKYNLTNHFIFSANLRQGLVEGFDPPFTPSLGFDYRFLPKWKWSANISKSYRVPTLNDRYWNPGGNLLLKPEEGEHAESSLQFSDKSFRASLTGFLGDVKNWIIWRPEGTIWTPKNVDQVVMKGVEASFKWNILPWLAWENAYAYNQTTRKKSDIIFSEGKQLEYTPYHQFRSNLGFKNSFGGININGQWTDERYTNADNSNSLEAFLLLNASIDFSPDNEPWSIALSCNNMLDTDYQLMINRALPGRNFQLNVQYKFNFNKS